MEKSRNYVVFGVLALVVSLVAVSLAYAGFTQTLTVNGAANVKGAKWDVHFENVANQTLDTTNSTSGVTSSGVWVQSPRIVPGTTVVSEYSVVLKTPGDRASFTFETVNEGNWKANLTGITLGTVSCTADGWKQDTTHPAYGDVTAIEDGFSCATALTYELFDLGADGNATPALVASNGAYTNGDLAAKTGKRVYKLVLTYVDSDNATVTPQEEVTVTVTPTVFSYTQNGAYVD